MQRRLNAQPRQRFLTPEKAPVRSGKYCNRWNRGLGNASYPRFRPDAPLPLAREKTCPQVGGPRGMPWGRFSEPPACASPAAPLGYPGAREMSERSSGWSRKFEDPIALADGREFITLRDAADYIMKLPKKESDLPEWQTAIEVLMLVSRSGPTMMARIGMMRALNGKMDRGKRSLARAHK